MHGDRYDVIMKDPEEYRGLLFTLIGKRLSQQDFEMVHALLNRTGKDSKWKKARLKSVEKMIFFFDLCM